MMSIDTNILFHAIDSTHVKHEAARKFLNSLQYESACCLCEQVLLELYCLLRNPAVCKKPLSAKHAVDVIQGFRTNQNWRVVDVQPEPAFMEDLWLTASAPTFAYRKIFDVRLAKTLLQHGVTDFATRNLKDFKNAGFIKVWDPLEG